jgi:hypothetical protein
LRQEKPIEIKVEVKDVYGDKFNYVEEKDV